MQVQNLQVQDLPVRDSQVRDRIHPALAADFAFFDGLVPANAATTGFSAKRALDFAIALAALIVCLPLLGLIALLIRCDSRGPALFTQTRTGLNGKSFTIYKFRTMAVQPDDGIVVQATRDDSRVTRIGRALRKSSLDELPQLFNVLAGDMSLVGPRPHARVHDEFYAAHLARYRLRQRVKPGITGWAQIHGARGATPHLSDMQARLDLDLFYVAHQGFGLDLKILARTPLALLLQRNAY